MAKKKKTRKKKPPSTQQQSDGANLGFEGKLWAAADKLRGNMDAAEYIHYLAPQGLAGFVSVNRFDNPAFHLQS